VLLGGGDGVAGEGPAVPEDGDETPEVISGDRGDLDVAAEELGEVADGALRALDGAG